MLRLLPIFYIPPPTFMCGDVFSNEAYGLKFSKNSLMLLRSNEALP